VALFFKPSAVPFVMFGAPPVPRGRNSSSSSTRLASHLPCG
jgi:hypothetical protein